ncbi:MAG TPA: type II secretion system protein N [Dyella sp.]|uniref:type II secretion system protein N n=1 Tax=Dyella sp. TaxID=1869338 RepID=UPI002D77A6BA|nr:type II secretion system protein N [Dyella sp.]HET6554325.1 type II secretion system protein N [Dyella sp.]
MKHWRIALAAFVGLLLIGFALLWFMPARWAVPLLAGRLNGLQLHDVSGLLWQGRAGQVVSATGTPLGPLEWTLDRRALLGEQHVRVDLQGPRVQLHGRMDGRNAAEAVWTDVQMRADMDALGPRLNLPMGRPRGVLQLTANRAQLHGGWPVVLDARIHWQDATLRTPHQGELPLGDLTLSLRGSNGVVEGHLHDDGNGPLRIDGRLQLSPLAWRFNAVAAPRQPAPALQRWLASFGAVDADGVTHIQYKGGLAAAMPEGKS